MAVTEFMGRIRIRTSDEASTSRIQKAIALIEVARDLRLNAREIENYARDEGSFILLAGAARFRDLAADSLRTAASIINDPHYANSGDTNTLKAVNRLGAVAEKQSESASRIREELASDLFGLSVK